jgi:hypothetical protein
MPKQALAVARVSTQEQACGNRLSIPHHGHTPHGIFRWILLLVNFAVQMAKSSLSPKKY